MSNTPIELKGSNFTLSVVHLHEAEPKIIHQALEDKIAQAPAFFKTCTRRTQCQWPRRTGQLVSNAQSYLSNWLADNWRQRLQKCETES